MLLGGGIPEATLECSLHVGTQHILTAVHVTLLYQDMSCDVAESPDLGDR